MDDSEPRGATPFHATAWHGDLGRPVARGRRSLDVRSHDIDEPRTLPGREAVAADLAVWSNPCAPPTPVAQRDVPAPEDGGGS